MREIIILITFAILTRAAEGCCHLDLDFALVQDTTRSYRVLTATLHRAMNTITDELDKKFYKVRYASIIFQDWGHRDGWEGRDFCHTLLHSFIEDKHAFQEKLKTVGVSNFNGGDAPKSSLSATILTALDKRMTWSKSTPERQVIKIIVTTTDSPSYLHGILPPQPPMKYDETDSCENDGPTTSEIGRIFREKDIFFVGLIATVHVPTWQRYLAEFGSNGIILPLNTNANVQQISNAILEGVGAACKAQTTTTTTTTPTERYFSSTPIIIGAAVAGATVLISAAGLAILIMRGGNSVSSPTVDAAFEDITRQPKDDEKESRVPISEGHYA